MSLALILLLFTINLCASWYVSHSFVKAFMLGDNINKIINHILMFDIIIISFILGRLSV